MNKPPNKMTIGEAKRHGRAGDTELVHLNRYEVEALRGLSPTGSLTINPKTGQQEAFLPFLASLLPMLFPSMGAGLAGATGISMLANPLVLGSALSGLGTAVETGDIKKGIMAGLGSYALGGLANGLGGALGGVGAGHTAAAAGGAADAVGQAASTAAGLPGAAALQNTAATAGQTFGASPASLIAGAPNPLLSPMNPSMLGANPLAEAAKAAPGQFVMPGTAGYTGLPNQFMMPGAAASNLAPVPSLPFGGADAMGSMGDPTNAAAEAIQNATPGDGGYAALTGMQRAGMGVGGMLGSSLSDSLFGGGEEEEKRKRYAADTESFPVPRTINMPPPGYQHGQMGEFSWFNPEDTITRIMGEGPGYATGGMVGGGTTMQGGGMYAPSTPKPDVMAMGGGGTMMQPYNTGIVPPHMQTSAPAQMNPPPRPMGPPQSMPPMPQPGGMGIPSSFQDRFANNQHMGGVMDRLGAGPGGPFGGGFFDGSWRQRMMERRANRGHGGLGHQDGQWGQDRPGFAPDEMQMRVPGFANGGTISVGKPYEPTAFDFARAMITAPPAAPMPSGGPATTPGVVAYTPPAGQVPVSQMPSTPSGGSNSGPGSFFGNSISGTGAIGNAALGTMGNASLGSLANQASGQNPSPFPSPNNRGMPVYQNPSTDYLTMMEQLIGNPGVRAFAMGGPVGAPQGSAPGMFGNGIPGAETAEEKRKKMSPWSMISPLYGLLHGEGPWSGGLLGLAGNLFDSFSNNDNDKGKDGKFARGGYVQGPGDGTSDSVPAVINGRGPAKLSDGEFVIPADVVAHLGNGSNRAGAKHLDGMIKGVRKQKTGKTRMPPRI